MIPSIEVEGLKTKVDFIVNYADADSKRVDEQADKVKSEIDKLALLLEEEP